MICSAPATVMLMRLKWASATNTIINGRIRQCMSGSAPWDEWDQYMPGQTVSHPISCTVSRMTPVFSKGFYHGVRGRVGGRGDPAADPAPNRKLPSRSEELFLRERDSAGDSKVNADSGGELALGRFGAFAGTAVRFRGKGAPRGESPRRFTAT